MIVYELELVHFPHTFTRPGVAALLPRGFFVPARRPVRARAPARQLMISISYSEKLTTKHPII